MKHIPVSTAGAVIGLVAGLVAGVGSTALLADASEPTERIVRVAAPDVPEEPDALVQWLKQHPRNR